MLRVFLITLLLSLVLTQSIFAFDPHQSDASVADRMRQKRIERESASAKPKDEWFQMLQQQKVVEYLAGVICQQKSMISCENRMQKSIAQCFESGEAKIPEMITESNKDDATEALLNCAMKKNS